MRLVRDTQSHRELVGLLESAGANVERSTALLAEVIAVWPDDEGRRHQLKELEHEGDRITHDVIHNLHALASTPFDRGSMFALASGLDDVVDFAEEVGDVLALYKVEAPTDHAIQLSKILHAAGSEVATVLAKLDTPEEMAPHLREIGRLEDEGDAVEREALTTLFAGGIDPMVVIRWKDIYERLEEGIDSCDRVANVLTGMTIRAT